MDVEGKVVLVTGAGKGAGRAAARLFASHGARVAANDISPVNLDSLVSESGGSIRSYPEDMAKKVGVQGVINQVEDELGSIAILVNHAAVHPHASLLEMDEWDWHRVLDVNLTAPFLLMQSAGRVMRASGGGLILNLISLPADGDSAAYEASMHGLVALTRAAARELGAHRIFVHAVGRGLGRYQNADPAAPKELNRALLYLCGATMNGQIIDVEAA